MISHHHACVFVHVPKVAGQSIEHVFLNQLDLSWDTRAPLLLRSNDRPELGPPALAHLLAREYVPLRYMTQAQFDSYYKFAFVRNPWHRVVSFYRYLDWGKAVDFRSFMDRIFPTRLWQDMHWFTRPQADFLLDDQGELLVDFVGSFEHIKRDWAVVCEALELGDTPLPHVNKSAEDRPGLLDWKRHLDTLRDTKRRLATRSGPVQHHKRYEDYYDATTRAQVAELYAADIELFGYRFGEREPSALPLRRAT
jgi:hypothetical protein